jgi:hypothetical protein
LKGDQLYFKGMFVLELEEKKHLVLEMHQKIKHIGE